MGVSANVYLMGIEWDINQLTMMIWVCSQMVDTHGYQKNLRCYKENQWINDKPEDLGRFPQIFRQTQIPNITVMEEFVLTYKSHWARWLGQYVGYGRLFHFYTEV